MKYMLLCVLASCLLVSTACKQVVNKDDSVLSRDTEIQNEINAEAFDEIIEESDCYRIVKTDNLYYCYFNDRDNNIVRTEGPLATLPKVYFVNDDCVRYTVQAGTGIGTQWGFYYDYKNNRMSDDFNCIFDQTDTKVVLFEDGRLIVRSIFDNDYYREITDFGSSFSGVVDPVISAVFSEDAESLQVTYLTGSDYVEITETFELY